MNTMKDIVARYLDSWNQIDAGVRRANIRGLFAEQCSYTDPNATVLRHDGIDGLIGAVQKQFAGLSFVLGGSVDAHHDVARFTWHAMAPGRQEPVAIGFDVLVMDGSRIKQVVGFLDKLPG